jgi:hypothetical protein
MENEKNENYPIQEINDGPNLNQSQATLVKLVQSLDDVFALRVFLQDPQNMKNIPDLNFRFHDGYTLLHVNKITFTSLRILIRYKADVNIQDNKGRTPLHVAAQRDDGDDPVRTLLANKADATVLDNRGYSCLDVMLERPKTNMHVLLNLLSAGAPYHGFMPDTQESMFIQRVIDSDKSLYANQQQQQQLGHFNKNY